MTQRPRANPYHWVTGRDVNTNDPALTPEDKQRPQAQSEAADSEEPNKSDNKPVWIDYRKAQGYTDEQLKGLDKDAVMELPDDPEEYEAPDDEE